MLPVHVRALPHTGRSERRGVRSWRGRAGSARRSCLLRAVLVSVSVSGFASASRRAVQPPHWAPLPGQEAAAAVWPALPAPRRVLPAHPLSAHPLSAIAWHPNNKGRTRAAAQKPACTPTAHRPLLPTPQLPPLPVTLQAGLRRPRDHVPPEPCRAGGTALVASLELPGTAWELSRSWWPCAALRPQKKGAVRRAMKWSAAGPVFPFFPACRAQGL